MPLSHAFSLSGSATEKAGRILYIPNPPPPLKPLERPLFRDRRLARRGRSGRRPRLFLVRSTSTSSGTPSSSSGPALRSPFLAGGAAVPRGSVDGVGSAAGGQGRVCRRRRSAARRSGAPARARTSRSSFRLGPRLRGARPRARVHARHQPRPRRERPVVLQQQPPGLLVERRLGKGFHQQAAHDDEHVS